MLRVFVLESRVSLLLEGLPCAPMHEHRLAGAARRAASGGGSGGDWGGGGGHVAGTCGDGFLDSGEYCDDGNTDAGDGCGLDCDLEADLGNCASTAPFILNGSQGVSWNARIDAASPLSDHWGCGSSKGRASFATIVSQVAGDVRLEIVAPFDVTLWLGEAACTAPQVGCATFSSQQGAAAGSMTVHFAPHEQRLLKVLAPSNALGAYTIRARYVEP